MYCHFLVTILILSLSLDCGILIGLPDGINPCKWDQETIDECVLENMEKQKIKFKYGVPQLGIPSFRPFCVEEEIHPVLPGMSLNGRNVKITGIDDFIVKKIHLDLDKYTIQLKLLFPKLHLEGEGTLEGLMIGMPIKGAGTFIADAMKTSTSSLLHFDIVERDGTEYLRIDKSSVDINIKDYELQLDGLFKDKVLNEAITSIANKNRNEMLHMTKPYIEMMVNKIIMNIVNDFVKNVPVDILFKDRS